MPVRFRPRAPFIVRFHMTINLKTCVLWLFLMSCCGSTLHANTTGLSADEQNRYQQLTRELRCVVCQNQDLAESNTPLAIELRQQITEQLQQKKTDADIKAYLSARYGEFILFKPTFSPKNYVLWLAPFICLLGALWLLLALLQQRKNTLIQTPLSAQETQALEKLLQ